MISFAIPGDLDSPTGGYGFARRVISEWQSSGIAHEIIALPAAFPFPDDAGLSATADALRGRDTLLIDGLAYGAFTEALAAEIGPRSTVLLHHPLYLETGLSDAEAERLHFCERAALKQARRVVTTSEATTATIARSEVFDVPLAKITTAEPGLDLRSAAPLIGDPPRIISVGSIIPRKGYRDLVEALESLDDLPWRCDIFGSLDLDPVEVSDVTAMIVDSGLQGRMALQGSIDARALEAAYAQADIFVSAALYEGYGMAVTEAMAHGLPIVATKIEAHLGTIGENGLLAALNDPPDLARALREVIESEGKRRALGSAAHARARALPRWPDTAQRIAEAVLR